MEIHTNNTRNVLSIEGEEDGDDDQGLPNDICSVDTSDSVIDNGQSIYKCASTGSICVNVKYKNNLLLNDNTDKMLYLCK